MKELIYLNFLNLILNFMSLTLIYSICKTNQKMLLTPFDASGLFLCPMKISKFRNKSKT